MIDVSRVVVGLGLCVLSVGCGPGKDPAADTGGGSVGTADTGEGDIGDAAPTSAVTGDTTDGVTADATDGDTGADDTGDLASELETCALAEPCGEVTIWCDYDGCASPNAMPDDATLCAWTRLRDGEPVRLHIAESYTGDLNIVAVVVGDPGRTLLRHHFSPGDVRDTCKLADPSFFQACIDAPGGADHCFQTNMWVVECERTPAFVCPGA